MMRWIRFCLIVLTLGLESCFNQVRMSLYEGNVTAEIRLEIEEVVKWAGDNVADPYYGLKE